MTNSKSLLQHIRAELTTTDEGEKEATALLLVEHFAGLTRAEILTGRNADMSASVTQALSSALTRVNAGEPVQYVVGWADFLGLRFDVDPRVLVPRPETEGLVLEVRAVAAVRSPLRILDIGTGSGCIAITLARALPQATVTATDISEDALNVARSNARRLRATVNFLQDDILQNTLQGSFDVIVSNPPYIPLHERETLPGNVARHEPATALFVPDDRPQLFYEAIATHSEKMLVPGGVVLTEIHERYHQEVLTLFRLSGFHAQALPDLSGKPRIVRAIRLP